MFKEWIKLLFNLFLPRSCAVCGAELLIHEHHLCLTCYAGVPLTYFWKIKDNPAEVVFWGRSQVERVYALFYYVNNYRKPLHELKYRSNLKIGIYLGKILGQKIAAEPGFLPFDYIVPVPLHYKKRWKRGYNQSQIIAVGVQKGIYSIHGDAGHSQVEPHILIRRHFTPTQTEKDRVHRWQNVASAFDINHNVAEKMRRKNRHQPIRILLTDDVLTTGATLEACSNILHKHFNCQISIATLAYVE